MWTCLMCGVAFDEAKHVVVLVSLCPECREVIWKTERKGCRCRPSCPRCQFGPEFSLEESMLMTEQGRHTPAENGVGG